MGKSSSSSSRPVILQCSWTIWRWRVRSATWAARDGCGGEDKVLSACLDPRLSDNRQRGHGGNEGEVFEDGDGKVGLLSWRLTSKGDDLDAQEEYVGEQQAHASGDEQQACCCRPGEKLRAARWRGMRTRRRR